MFAEIQFQSLQREETLHALSLDGVWTETETCLVCGGIKIIHSHTHRHTHTCVFGSLTDSQELGQSVFGLIH